MPPHEVENLALEKPHYEAMIRFVEGIYDYNYYQVIAEKVKDFEVDGWKACLSGPFCPFRMRAEGKYQVTFIRKIPG